MTGLVGVSSAHGPDRRVDIVLLGVAVVWGSSYLSTRVLAVAAGVLAVLALRYWLSFAALLMLWWTHRPDRIGRRQVLVGLLLGLSQAAVLVLETYGVTMTSATNAGLLISSTILLTPLIDGFVSRRWLPPGFFVAAVVAVAGIVLLIGDAGLAAPSVGDGLVLLAAVVRACHVTASGHLTRDRPYDAVTLTLLQTMVGATVCTLAGGTAVVRSAAGLTAHQWVGIAYLALGSTVFAFVAQLWAIRRTSPARASLLMGTEPLWAVAIGISLGGETLTAMGAVGAALLLTGTYAGQRAEGRQRLRPFPIADPLRTEPHDRPHLDRLHDRLPNAVPKTLP